MGSSPRFLSGSLTKGSVAINIGAESSTVDLNLYKQGRNIQTIEDLTSAAARMKIRSHAGVFRTLVGRSIDTNVFDETTAPIVLSGSSAEMSSPSVNGRFKYFIKHDREKRDLGQSDLYTEGSLFVELDNPDNAVNVIQMFDRGKELPISMADNSAISNFDGKIDVLSIFKTYDGSTTDFPFFAKGPSGNFAQVQDFLRRSSEVSDKVTLPDGDFVPTSFFMDAPENFGNVLIPSVMNFNSEPIKPFKDFSNDAERYLNSTGKFTEEGNTDIKSALQAVSFTDDDSRGTFDRMTVGGFDYEGGDTDSILFGGLIR